MQKQIEIVLASLIIVAFSVPAFANGWPTQKEIHEHYNRSKSVYEQLNMELKPDVAEDKATIYIYRKRKILGAVVRSSVVLNKDVIVPVKNRGCSAAIVEPGPIEMSWSAGIAFVIKDEIGTKIHTGRQRLDAPLSNLELNLNDLLLVEWLELAIKHGLAPNLTARAFGTDNWFLSAETKPGHSYYFRFGLNEGGRKYGHGIFPMTKEEAMIEARNCKFRSPNYVPIGSWSEVVSNKPLGD